MALTKEKRKELATNLNGFMEQTEMRQAMEYGRDKILDEQRDFYNLNDAAKESMKIKALLDNADEIELDVKQQDHIRAMYNRNENFLLVNKTKLGGDSDVMRLVKDKIKAYEGLIQVNTQGNAAATAQLVNSAKALCEDVIGSCEAYLSRGRSIFFWRWGRYEAVQKARERFENELAKLEKISTEKNFEEYKDDLQKSDTLLSLIIDDSLTSRVSKRKSMEKRNTEYNNSTIQEMNKANSAYANEADPIRNEISEEDKKENPALCELAVGMAVLSKKKDMAVLSKKKDETTDYGSASDYIESLKTGIKEKIPEEEKIGKIKRMEDVLFAISNVDLSNLFGKDLKRFYGKDYKGYKAIFSIAANCDGIMSMYEGLINKNDPAVALDKKMFDKIKAKKNSLLYYKGRIESAEKMLNDPKESNQDIQAKSKLSDIRGNRDDDDFKSIKQHILNNKLKLDIRLREIAIQKSREERKIKVEEKQVTIVNENVNIENTNVDDGSLVINEIREKIKKAGEIDAANEIERKKKQELEEQKFEEKKAARLKEVDDEINKEKEKWKERNRELQGQLEELSKKMDVMIAKNQEEKEEAIKRYQEEVKKNEEIRMKEQERKEQERIEKEKAKKAEQERIQREKDAAAGGGARILEALDDRIKKGQAHDNLDDKMSAYRENKKMEQVNKERPGEVTGVLDAYFKEQEENERKENERKENERKEKERIEQEKAKKERKEKERTEKEKAEKEIREKVLRYREEIYKEMRNQYLSLPADHRTFSKVDTLWEGEENITALKEAEKQNDVRSKELTKIHKGCKELFDITDKDLEKNNNLKRDWFYISAMSNDEKEKEAFKTFISGVKTGDQSKMLPYIEYLLKEVGSKLPTIEMLTPAYIKDHAEELFFLHHKVMLLEFTSSQYSLGEKNNVFYKPFLDEWMRLMDMEMELSKIYDIDIGYNYVKKGKNDDINTLKKHIQIAEKRINDRIKNEAGMKTSMKYELSWNPFVDNKLDETRKGRLNDPTKDGIGAYLVDTNPKLLERAKRYGKETDPKKGEKVAIKLLECGLICQDETETDKEKLLLADAVSEKMPPIAVALKEKLLRIQKMGLNLDESLEKIGNTGHQNTRYMELIKMGSQVENIKKYYPDEYNKFSNEAKKVIEAQLAAIKIIGKAAMLMGEVLGTRAGYDEKTMTFKEIGAPRNADTVLKELKDTIESYKKATKVVEKEIEANKVAEAARNELRKEKLEAEEAKMKQRISKDKELQKHLTDRKKAIRKKSHEDEKNLSKEQLLKLETYENSNVTTKTEKTRMSEAATLRNNNFAARDMVAKLRMDAPMELRKKLNYAEFAELTDVCLIKEGKISIKEAWQHDLMSKYASTKPGEEPDEALSMMLSEIKKISVKQEDLTDAAILKNSAKLENYSKALYSYNILMQRNPKFREANKKELDTILMVQKARLDYFRIRRTLLCNSTWQKTGAKGLGAPITEKDDISGRQSKRLFSACQSMSEKLAKGYSNADEAERFSLLVDDLIQQEQNVPKDYMKLDLANPEAYMYKLDRESILLTGSQGADAAKDIENVIKSMGRHKLLTDLRKMVRQKFTTLTLKGPKFTCAKDFSNTWEVADSMSRMITMFCGPLTQDMSSQEVLELFHNMDIDQSYDGLGMEDDAEQREFCEQAFGDAAARFFTLMQCQMQKTAYAFGDTMVLAHPGDLLRQSSPLLKEFFQCLGIYSNTVGGWDDRLMEKYGNNYNCDFDNETFHVLGSLTSNYSGLYTQILPSLTGEYGDGKDVEAIDNQLEDTKENKPYMLKTIVKWADKKLPFIDQLRSYFFAHPELMDPDRLQKIKKKDGSDFFPGFASLPKIMPLMNNIEAIKKYREFMKKHGYDYKKMDEKEVENYMASLKKRGYQTILPTSEQARKKVEEAIKDVQSMDPDFQLELEGNANLEKSYLNDFKGINGTSMLNLFTILKE